jgi:hypothetical protein
MDAKWEMQEQPNFLSIFVRSDSISEQVVSLLFFQYQVVTEPLIFVDLVVFVQISRSSRRHCNKNFVIGNKFCGVLVREILKNTTTSVGNTEAIKESALAFEVDVWNSYSHKFTVSFRVFEVDVDDIID